jgi:ActR/RegA family two-component response regulator
MREDNPALRGDPSNRRIRPAVLVVDDDRGTRETFDWTLTLGGFSVETTGSGLQGILMARSNRYDLLLVDWRLPDISGIDVIRSLSDIEDLHVILMSGFLTVPIAVEAMKLGAVDVLEKPLTMEGLLEIASGLVCAPPMPRHAAVVFSSRSAPASDELEWHGMTRPGSVAERWAMLVLRGCESERDLKTLRLWATCAGVSYTSLRESCGLVGIRPHDARDLTRVLRAVIQSCRHHCSPDVLLDVSDRRTIETLFGRAGLDAASRSAHVSIEQFFESQHFVLGQNAGLRVLRHLLDSHAEPF